MSSDPQNPPPALQYAFVLAWAHHLDALKAAFDRVAENPQTALAECCSAEELSVGLRVVKNYGLRTLADKFVAADLAQNSPLSTQPTALLSLMLHAQLLGGPAKTYAHVSTDELLLGVDRFGAQENPLAQPPVLLAKLNLILRQATKLALSLACAPADVPQHTLSALLAAYLAAQSQSLTSANAFEGMSADTLAFLKGSDPVACSWDRVFDTFVLLVHFQLDLSAVGEPADSRVLTAREVGNNLMVNTCYPQAIAEYTDGINAVDHTTLNNLAQLYTNRAIAYIGLNCFLEAVTDLQRAVQHDRTFTPAWAQLAYCHLYLGSSFLALQCYLTALRTHAGEIYPENFPQSALLKQEYTENKLRGVMPQFVQRLVLSIILAERRAEQQREPALAVQEITGRVRAILARVRSYVAPEDLQYLSYAYESDIDHVRSTAARASRVRPSILTPDVAQDILASTNVEASAVTFHAPVRPEAAPAADATSDAMSETPTPAAELNDPPQEASSNLRGFFNNLGEFFGDVMSAQSQTQPESTETQEPRESEPELDPIAQALSQAQRAINEGRQVPNGSETFQVGGIDVGAGFGGIISQALRNHQAAYQRARGRRAQTPNRPSREPTRSEPGSQPTRPVLVSERSGRAPASDSSTDSESRPRRTPGEDTEMPDALDLD